MKYILIALAFTACTEKKNDYTYMVIGKDTIIAKNASIDLSKIKGVKRGEMVNDSVTVITISKTDSIKEFSEKEWGIQVETNNGEINYNKTVNKK